MILIWRNVYSMSMAHWSISIIYENIFLFMINRINNVKKHGHISWISIPQRWIRRTNESIEIKQQFVIRSRTSWSIFIRLEFFWFRLKRVWQERISRRDPFYLRLADTILKDVRRIDRHIKFFKSITSLISFFILIQFSIF